MTVPRFPWKLTLLFLLLTSLLGCGALDASQRLGSQSDTLIMSSPNLTFGPVVVGGSRDLSEIIYNRSRFPVTITQATVSGTDFKIVSPSLPVTVRARSGVRIVVRFTPQSAGSPTGTIAIASTAPEPTTITLSGAAVDEGRLNVLPASLSFGSVPVGKSQSKSARIVNSGSTMISISAMSVSQSSFVTSGLTLPITLGPGQGVTFDVAFSPRAKGTAEGTVSLAAKASLSPVTTRSRFRNRATKDKTVSIPLSGTGAGSGQLSASPASLQFSGSKVGASSSKTVALTNTGDASVAISQAAVTGSGFNLGAGSLPVTLAPGQSQSLTVTFSPSASGSAAGSLNVVSDATDSSLSVPLSGTTNSAPTTGTVTFSPGSLSFGTVQIGGSKTQTGTLTNSGQASVTVSQASVIGQGFTLSATSFPMTISAGQSKTLSVLFSPKAAGSASGSMAIASNASNSTVNVALSATGETAAAPGTVTLSPTSLSFGSVQVGSSKAQSATWKNTGKGSATINQATITGNGFSLSGVDLPLTLDPGESFTFAVTFQPTAGGTTSGGVTVASDSSASVPTLALSGSGTALGKLTVSPASLSFGNVVVGSSKNLTATLSASGSSVTVTSVDAGSPEFSVSGATFPLTLNAGQTASLTIRFTPQSSGSAAGSISVASNSSPAASGPSLAGAGVAAPQHTVDLAWSPSGSSITGYNVYRGLKSGGPYSKLVSSDSTTSYTDNSVDAGTLYFYVITARDQSGTESGFSNEVQASIPTP